MNNTITVTGRLGADPQLRQTKLGKSVCNIGLAVNERIPRGAGFVERTAWHRIVCWQKLAENAQSLRKGQPIRVTGFQKSRSFTGRDGLARTVVEIIAEKVELLDALPQPAPAAPARTQSSGGVPRAQIPADDSDIPF
jgi:single-strand DNA-binding protein